MKTPEEEAAAEEYGDECLRDVFQRGMSSITTQAVVVNMMRAFKRGVEWERERCRKAAQEFIDSVGAAFEAIEGTVDLMLKKPHPPADTGSKES